MNAKHLMMTLAALSAVAVCANSYAEVGWMDGDNIYSRLDPADSSVEVQPEPTEYRSTGDIGPRGVSGSLYSARTREEVADELIEHQLTHPGPLRPGDLYFEG